MKSSNIYMMILSCIILFTITDSHAQSNPKTTAIDISQLNAEEKKNSSVVENLFAYKIAFHPRTRNIGKSYMANNNSVELHYEENTESKSSIKLLADRPLREGKKITFSFIVKVETPTDEYVQRGLKEGLISFVLQESDIIHYDEKEIYYSKESNKPATITFNPPKNTTKEYNDLLKNSFSVLLGPLSSINSIAQSIDNIIRDDKKEPMPMIDLNEYDVINISWSINSFSTIPKIKVNIPVTIYNPENIGFYANWSCDYTKYKKANVSTFPLFNLDYKKSNKTGSSTIKYAGKTYHTIKIGNQLWLKENLDVGSMINGSEEMKDNEEIEKYCYNNDPENCEKYGGLYQWGEAMQYSTTEGAKGICPEGWHIPTLAEFEELVEYVNDEAAALIDGREILEYTPSVKQNKTGFSALLSFTRKLNYFNDGYFTNLGDKTSFWSSYASSSPYIMYLHVRCSDVIFGNFHKDQGFSVRCVKD